jgi:hypothetical protein
MTPERVPAVRVPGPVTAACRLNPFARSILGIAVFGGVGVLIATSVLFDPGGGPVAVVLGAISVVGCVGMVGLCFASAIKSARRTHGE